MIVTLGFDVGFDAWVDGARARMRAAREKHGRVVLLGFSQGACLSLEFAARQPRRYGGVVGFSGGLIGAAVTPDAYAGFFNATPVLLGCSDVDPHIPLIRVRETAEVMRGLGAAVTERIYPGLGHTINEDEIAHARAILNTIM